MTRWWHLKVLRHKPQWYQILAAITVVGCECGARWEEKG